MLLAALVGFLLIASYFVPPLARLSTYATNSFNILAAIAFILGAGNFFRSHSEKIRRRVSGWAYSLIAIIAFLTMLVAGLFKLNVDPKPGFSSYMVGSGGTVGLADVAVTPAGDRTLSLTIRKAQPNTEYPVTLGDAPLGKIVTDKDGRGNMTVSSERPTSSGELVVAALGTGATAVRELRAGQTIAVGDILRGALEPYGGFTGDEIEAETAVFGYLYLKAFVPLQQTTFALLAFYVASAAFRAFRARNIESVLLLGTAFIILLGRTAAGVVLTQWLPEQGFWSFFRMESLSIWVMGFPFTAGSRAILIGIALGVISTSLRVLLGIDRAYLGSKGGAA
jgi:hypothetical protein